MSNRKILLRFDDICSTMNWEQWEKAKQMMDDAGVAAMLGVVPDCTDPDLMTDEAKADFWEYINELQKKGYAIAMHGYHHQFELKADGLITKNKISEFAGLPYDVQLEKIRKGKEILNSHGIETDIFFAPAHSYDDNTLRALAECGFKYVSDGYSCKPYMRHGILLLPCRSTGIPKMSNKDAYYTAVVHAHEWVRADKKRDMEKFMALFGEMSNEIVSFETFSKWKPGNAYLQRIDEIIYKFVRIHIMPSLVKIKRSIFH